VSAKLAGFQKEQRAISALPVRIDYRGLVGRYEVQKVGKDDDVAFSPSKSFPYDHDSLCVHRTPGFMNFDPYAIRSAFEEISDLQSAHRFLEKTGHFWPMGPVRLSQIFEWQSYFKWLRIPPEKAIKDPRGKEAWLTAIGARSNFFAKGQPEQDEQALQGLRSYALNIERNILPGGQVMCLGWYKAGDPFPSVAAREWMGAKQRPTLFINAYCTVEAIAATIYVDRISGISYGNCKRCGKFFEVKSGHSQQFCPPLGLQAKSACSNAFHAKLGRDRARLARKVAARKST
jgi:hypothetical protein